MAEDSMIQMIEKRKLAEQAIENMAHVHGYKLTEMVARFSL